MKLDMDLVRKILLVIEESNSPLTNNDSVILKDCDRIEDKITIDYHLKKMYEGNLIICGTPCEVSALETIYTDIELSWEGHQFVEQIREDLFWGKLKTRVVKAGVGISLHAFKIGAPILIKELLANAIN